MFAFVFVSPLSFFLLVPALNHTEISLFMTHSSQPLDFWELRGKAALTLKKKKKKDSMKFNLLSEMSLGWGWVSRRGKYHWGFHILKRKPFISRSPSRNGALEGISEEVTIICCTKANSQAFLLLNSLEKSSQPPAVQQNSCPWLPSDLPKPTWRPETSARVLGLSVHATI